MTCDPLTLFALVFKATLFSNGGTGNLPSLHGDLVTTRGWLTGAQMAEAVGIGQLAPGPTGLWVVSLGYTVDGVRGALIATIAVTLPPMLALIIARLYGSVKHLAAVEGFLQGMGLAVVGVGAVILYRLLDASAGVTPGSLALVALGGGLLLTRRLPVIAILALAGVLGAVTGR